MAKNIELRPRQVLKEVGKTFPNAWKDVKSFREGKGKDLPDWADWCYLPIAAGVAIATGGVDERIIESGYNDVTNPATVTAAATWRLSQGVYKFDYDLYESLINQPMNDELPCEALKRLPEYCVYIETHNAKWADAPIDGFFAHLEQDMNDWREELRFVFLLKDGGNIPFAVHLGNWTLDEGLKKMQEEAQKQAKTYLNFKLPFQDFSKEITPFLQLVLYLCADNIDVPKKPQHPSTKSNKKGVVEAVKAPRHWNIGERIGSTIRKYRNTEMQKEQEDEREEKEGFNRKNASPRPHVRRAHWHSFWKGPRDGKRKLIVHWIPPIPVGLDKDDDNPVVIHPVK